MATDPSGTQASSRVGVQTCPTRPLALRPVISVVIPARNAARFLGATLDSLLAQREDRWECVVVDDGSTDATFDIAQAYGALDRRFRVYRTQAAGASAARNYGFRHIARTAEFVSFMDSDDVWFPDALELLMRRLVRDPAALGAHGLGEWIDAGGAVIDAGVYPEVGRNRLGLEGRRLVRWPVDRPTSFDVLINGNVLFPPGLILTRRRGYELAGPFDERLSGPEDWDMLIRLSRFGDFAFVNEVILYYRRHDANAGARGHVARQAWLVRCMAFHSVENSAAQRASARRGWRAYQVRLGSARLRDARRALQRGDFCAAARLVVRLPAHCLRYARGYPRPKVSRAPLTW